MVGWDIKCKHIANIMYVLPSYDVNLVKFRGFFASAKYIGIYNACIRSTKQTFRVDWIHPYQRAWRL